MFTVSRSRRVAGALGSFRIGLAWVLVALAMSLGSRVHADPQRPTVPTNILRGQCVSVIINETLALDSRSEVWGTLSNPTDVPIPQNAVTMIVTDETSKQVAAASNTSVIPILIGVDTQYKQPSCKHVLGYWNNKMVIATVGAREVWRDTR